MFCLPVDCTNSQSESVHRRSQGANWNATKDKKKYHKNDYCFFSFSFFLFLRVQQYTRTTVINNNIDPRGPGPLNLIFANQFKRAPLQ